MTGTILISMPASRAGVAAMCPAAWDLMTGSPAVYVGLRKRRET
jgi:hypothetical protein